MKKTMVGCMVTTILLCTFQVRGQETAKKLSIGLGLEAGIVTGDYKEIYSFSPGLTVRGLYKAGPGFATLTTGAIIYIPKSLDGEDLKAALRIPVKVGYKYIVHNPFFVMGEVGFSSVRTYYDTEDGNVASVKQSGFTYAPSIGVQASKFEVSLRYESTSLKLASLSGMFLRLGLNF